MHDLSARSLVIDEDYQETVDLDGLGRLTLRLIRPEDKALLVAGLHQMSSQSQYLRFFTPKGELSDEELHYLTELDNDDHLAIGAALQDGREKPLAVGLARYVRCSDRPDIAEAAIAVVDAYQHRGIGNLLMNRLSAAARQHGIRWFECEFLIENRRIEHLIRRLSTEVDFEALDAGRVRATIPLGQDPLEQVGEAAMPARKSAQSPSRARRLGLLLFKRKGAKERESPES